MKNFRYKFPEYSRAVLPLLAVMFLALAGCSFSQTKAKEKSSNLKTLTLMTWNLQNLFDGNDDGTEYDEYRESSGWTAEKYRGRLNAFAAAIRKIEPLPDIITVQEVESRKILVDLAGSLSGYCWSHFANNPDAALGLGMISRFPLAEAKAHSITINGAATPRPVLETKVQAGDEAFVIFACHWKSKLGGDDVTENVRKASARVILRRIRELREEEPELGIIVTGDLNENHDEFVRRNAAIISALLPDDPFCAQLAGFPGSEGTADKKQQMDFIIISRNKPPVPVNFPERSVVLYSPWTQELENGSYYYKQNWETIDHFLISSQFFNNSGWNYEKAEVLSYEPFAVGGVPVPYNLRTGSGLSDHLPLLLTLKK